MKGKYSINPVIMMLITGFFRLYRFDKSEHVFAAMFRGAVRLSPVGTGETALKYLAPYIFRVALSNNRLLSMDHDQVTFRYTNGQTHQTCTKTLPALTFLEQFLQHVLPKGFVKVRYFGLFCPAKRAFLRRIRAQLMLSRGQEFSQPPVIHCLQEAPLCPQCGAVMRRQELPPVVGRSPPVVALTA